MSTESTRPRSVSIRPVKILGSAETHHLARYDDALEAPRKLPSLGLFGRRRIAGTFVDAPVGPRVEAASQSVRDTLSPALIAQSASRSLDAPTTESLRDAVAAARSEAQHRAAELIEQARIEAASAAAIAAQAAVADALGRAHAQSSAERDAAVAAAVRSTEERLRAEMDAAVTAFSAQAETARRAAVADAVAMTQRVADEARAKAVSDGIAAAVADARERHRAELAEVTALAQRAAEHRSRVAIEAALADAEVARSAALAAASAQAEAIRSSSIADALAEAAATASLEQAQAVERAVADYAADAAARSAATERALIDAEARQQAAFAEGLARMSRRIATLSLSEVEPEMTDLGRPRLGSNSIGVAKAGCRALLRAKRQNDRENPDSNAKLSVAKLEYDQKLHSVLRGTKLPDCSVRGIVSVAFSVTDDGAADFVELVSSSGDERLDAAAANAVRSARLPIPPAEMVGELAYEALLHFG